MSDLMDKHTKTLRIELNEDDGYNTILSPTEDWDGDYFTLIGHGERQTELAKRIQSAVNERPALLKVEEALKEARGTLAREGWTDKGLEFIDSALSQLEEARHGK